MPKKTYNLSFTTGGLLFTDSLVVAQLYGHHGDWESVRRIVRADNLLQARTQNSAKRILQEIVLRVKHLTEGQLELLLSGSPSEQRLLLWVAICKRYALIREFASEIVREKFLAMNHELFPYEYETFFEDKAETHPEMKKISRSTRNKLRQVVFRMLREAGLIAEKNMIQPVLLTHNLADVIVRDNPGLLAIFPVSDADIKGWVKK